MAQFTAAVDEDDDTPRIVVVNGIISGEDNIRIGSNKSIIGLSGASESGLESNVDFVCGADRLTNKQLLMA